MLHLLVENQVVCYNLAPEQSFYHVHQGLDSLDLSRLHARAVGEAGFWGCVPWTVCPDTVQLPMTIKKGLFRGVSASGASCVRRDPFV